MTNMNTKTNGKNGSKNSLVQNGVEANDLNKNGACIAEVISTTCAKNTKSGTLPFLPGKKK